MIRKNHPNSNQSSARAEILINSRKSNTQTEESIITDEDK
jgi:hypothetical protein